MAFEITQELLNDVAQYIETKNNDALNQLFNGLHHADIAEILDELSFDEAVYIIRLLDSETTAEVLIDVDDDVREKILNQLTAKEIAGETHSRKIPLLKLKNLLLQEGHTPLYFMEVEGHIEDRLVRSLFESLSEKYLIKHLGSYPL